MSSLKNIPERYEEGFKQLYAIEDDVYESLKAAVLKAPYTSSIESLALNILTEELDYEIIEPILESVGSLTRLLEREDTAKGLIDDLCNLLEQGELISFETRDRQKFSLRVSELLQTEQLYYASKVRELLIENGNIFIQSRIFSDIRPVFNIKVEEPKVGVIVHNLHIHYQSDIESDHKDIYFTLDSSDIKALKEVILQTPVKLTTLSRSKLTTFSRSKLTTSGRSKLTT